jgi:arginine deiminase
VVNDDLTIDVRSEIGTLRGVILHRPGAEVALMTPATAKRALYSDILNRTVAEQEYAQLEGVLARCARTFQVRDLLAAILENSLVRASLIERVCARERALELVPLLQAMSPADLTTALIEGVPLVRDNLTRFLSPERFSLPPLHNFFFTRDAAAAVGRSILIGRMASPVRTREALIMEAIFDHHPLLRTRILNPLRNETAPADLAIEGGDVMVVREDVLVVGIGQRTSSRGVDLLLERLPAEPSPRHVLVQELPRQPESFIHLDMVFTCLDRDLCMVYAPLLLQPSALVTVHIELAGGKVRRIRTVDSLLAGLRELGLDLATIACGGLEDRWVQEREQWHAGTNFFALAPGKVIGYARNEQTIAELDRAGFAVLRADEVVAGRADPATHARCVVTIDGSELARGGGGGRCLTLPIAREAL